MPGNFEELKVWMTNFLTVLEAHIEEFGMVAADLNIAKNFNTAFGATVTDYENKKTALAVSSSLRKDQRDGLVDLVRPIIDQINHHPAMTNDLRVQLGLKPRNLASEPITPIDQLTPLVVLESTLGKVTVHWGPNPGNERMNGRPPGVKGAVIYRRQAGIGDYQMVGFSNSSPFFDYVIGSAMDYTYIVRYRGSKDSELSDQSEPATVAARGDIAA